VKGDSSCVLLPESQLSGTDQLLKELAVMHHLVITAELFVLLARDCRQ